MSLQPLTPYRTAAIELPTTGRTGMPGVHQVQAGERLADICQQYGVQQSAVIAANPLLRDAQSPLHAGDRLNIPAPTDHPDATPTTDIPVGDLPIDLPGPLAKKPMDLPEATRILLENYDQVAGKHSFDIFFGAGHKISRNDLQMIADSKDPAVSQELRDAAKFVLGSPVSRNFLDVGAGKGSVDGVISKEDLQSALTTMQSGPYSYRLLDTAAGKGSRDGTVSKEDMAAALKDPSFPKAERDALLKNLSDEQLLEIIGKPQTKGSAADQARELKAFIQLARISPLGAAEAQKLADYKVPFTIDKGADDQGFSFWNGSEIHLSEKMIGGDPRYMTEVLAHEGGHAIFAKSGLEAKVQAEEAAGKIPKGMSGIINESFAGAFGNRAHIAIFGHDNPDSERHLALADDVGDSIANDKTFYANYYKVNTKDARAHIADIHRVMREDLVPYLQDIGLLGDNDLTRGLA